jgi:hypothetical protein
MFTGALLSLGLIAGTHALPHVTPISQNSKRGLAPGFTANALLIQPVFNGVTNTNLVCLWWYSPSFGRSDLIRYSGQITVLGDYGRPGKRRRTLLHRLRYHCRMVGCLEHRSR